MNDKEAKAVARVRQAKVKADTTTILCFVRHVGCESIMQTSLAEILRIANAF